MAARIQTYDNLQVAVMEPRGALIGGSDVHMLQAQARDLLAQGNRRLVIDLSGVTYLNSSGIGALISILHHYREAGGLLKLCGLEKNLKNIFVITKLIGLFDVEQSQADALGGLRAA